MEKLDGAESHSANPREEERYSVIVRDEEFFLKKGQLEFDSCVKLPIEQIPSEMTLFASRPNYFTALFFGEFSGELSSSSSLTSLYF